MSILADYLAEIRTIRNLGAGVAETSYYPPLANLFNAVGKHLKPKVICLIHLQNTGAGIPEAGFFTANQIQRSTTTSLPGQKPTRGVLEVKSFAANIDQLAASEQVLRYLTHYNQVLITNLREFRLLIVENGSPRKVDGYELANSTDGLFHPSTLKDHADLFPEFLERVLRRQSSITDPGDLAWFLASYAREARWRAENHGLSSFNTIKNALEQSLGLTFDGEKGEHFFISTLIQTLFYGIFSAWILWRRSPESRTPNAAFKWREAAWYLRIPVLRQLFNTVAEPGGLNATTLTEVLDLAGDALNRVEPVFFATFREEDAVNYFYEPFLEAFDPQLRKELGVWYTPREIVHYMVERVDHLLRTELNQPLGLASPGVRVLDPCCGTGAYLVAVLQRIHRTLLEVAGDDNALVSRDLRRAATTRIFGFEIMPAPFVIAHLQVAALLEDSGAALAETDRAQVFLTNALTGWIPEEHPQSVISDEFIREREAAEGIKQTDTILVILGNPPYNGYAGISTMAEELDLKTCYKQQEPGLPRPEGKGLNDLYVRFFRVAERRIIGSDYVTGNQPHLGVVCFISNSSWLDGFSHPTMRSHLLRNFDQVQIDNLNGDKYRTGKKTPDGLLDPSVFSTRANPEGIQPGTAITTLLKRGSGQAQVVTLRSLWGAGKLEQLHRETTGALETPYSLLTPEPLLGLPYAHLLYKPEYLLWPLLTDLFSSNYNGIQTSRDSLLVDTDRQKLEERMRLFLEPATQHLTYRPWQIRRFLYRPFDLRYLYWDADPTLLVRNREEYVGGHFENIGLILPKQNRVSYAGPFVSKSIVDLNSVDGGASIFAESLVTMNPLHGTTFQNNLSDAANLWLQNLGLSSPALFHHILAITHCPTYIEQNVGALQRDWPRIPLPTTAILMDQSAALGIRLAELLDPESSIELVTEWSFLAKFIIPPEFPEGTSDRDQHNDNRLAISANWGRLQGTAVMPGNGKFDERDWTPAELERLAALAAAQSLTLDQALTLLGDTCVDVYLNGAAFWSAVPANVWEYTLGGYQVLKKWLSYRELPLLGRPLHDHEAKYFALVVRRITAILFLGPALDASYEAILPTATGLPS